MSRPRPKGGSSGPDSPLAPVVTASPAGSPAGIPRIDPGRDGGGAGPTASALPRSDADRTSALTAAGPASATPLPEVGVTVAPVVPVTPVVVAAPAMTLPSRATLAPSPAIGPATLLARALAVLGVSDTAAPSGPLSALSVLAWGVFRDVEAGLLGGARAVRAAKMVVAPAATAALSPPVANGWSVAGAPDPASGRVWGVVSFIDPAGATLSYTAAASSTGGGAVSINRLTGAFVYTPTATQRRAATTGTTDTFTVRATNGVDTVDQVVTVAVDAGTPVAGAFTAGTPNSITGVVSGRARFTDPAGRSLTFSASGTSSGEGTVSVDPTSGVYTYTPTQAQRQQATAASTDTFTVTASNGVNSTTSTVTVAVGAGVPQKSRLTLSAANTTTGVVSGSSGGFTDPAGRTLTYSAPVTSAGGGTVSVDPTTGAFTYTPTQNQRQAATLATRDTVTLTASNGVNSATRTVSVPVDPGTPVAGTAIKDPADTGSGAVGGTAVFTDTAGRTLTYTAPTTSRGGGTVSIDTATGTFVYTPTTAQRRTAGAATTDTFTVRATNGARSITQTVTVNVRPTVPANGVITTTSAVPATGAISGTLRFSDSTGAPLTLSYTAAASSTGGGAVSINRVTGAFVYTPTATQRRAATTDTTDTFTVRATNGVDTVDQVVTVAVDAGTPVAGAFTAGTPNSITGVVSGRARFTDPAGRSLTFSASGTSSGEGTVSVDPDLGRLHLHPDPGSASAGHRGQHRHLHRHRVQRREQHHLHGHCRRRRRGPAKEPFDVECGEYHHRGGQRFIGGLHRPGRADADLQRPGHLHRRGHGERGPDDRGLHLHPDSEPTTGSDPGHPRHCHADRQ